MIQKTKIEYFHDNTLLEGYCALDTSRPGKKPAVLIAHDWSGRNEFACQKAEQLAELGYVGFALDMYGRGKIGKTNEDKQALMMPFKEDRALLRGRVLAGYEALRKLEAVNTARIGAMGYCFGGACVLDLARSGADVRSVVSFHGDLSAPSGVEIKKIHAKLLILHGYADPLVPLDQVLAFEKEMTEYNVDWQVHIFGNAMHAFTNPTAHDPNFGTVYNGLADKRSWNYMKEFFAETMA